MGTNYYVIKNECSCCKRSDCEHIGKSSWGWSFSFQGTESIRNFEQWLTNITGPTVARIVDEYDRVITVDELLQLIEQKRDGRNHAKSSGSFFYAQENWIDLHGNSFSGGDFS